MPLHSPRPAAPARDEAAQAGQDAHAAQDAQAGQDELIVLVDEAGQPIGTAPKLASHHRDTPLHLAFSSYVFDRSGRFLLSQRALTKKTWPGTWTNSCCGHPGPGEKVEDAVRRRLANELNLVVGDLVPLLPDFRYWAELDGVVENEICPVFGAVTDAEPVPNPDEVEAVRWVEWADVLAGRLDVELSPWCQLQLEQLAGLAALSSLLPSGSARP
jgi:isopentenyl-diphosphate delta-isomerase